MDANQEILEELGEFSRDVSMGALLNNSEHVECVAQWLRKQLSQLREDEKQTSRVPVLSGSSIGRATISDIAFTMFDGLDESGQNLKILLAELLNVDRHNQAMANNKSDERNVAAQLDAQNSEMGVRELAKFLRVAPSTISTWRPMSASAGRTDIVAEVANVCF